MTTHRPSRARRGILAAIGLVAGSALIAGCASGTAPAADASADPTEGGDVVFLIDSLGATWIPNNSSISSYQGHIWGHLTDKLIYVDAEGNLSPWVAESWEESEDKTEFTIHLKDGRHVLRRHAAGCRRRRREHRHLGEGPARRGHQPHRPLPGCQLRPCRGRRRDDRQGLLHRADAELHPDARLSRVDPDLARDAGAAGGGAGRPRQRHRQRPVRRRVLGRRRQCGADQARRLRLGS